MALGSLPLTMLAGRMIRLDPAKGSAAIFTKPLSFWTMTVMVFGLPLSIRHHPPFM
jgi:hypothetical protein